MIDIQTILLAIGLDRIPKFSKQRKVTQNPPVSKNTRVAPVEVQHHPAVTVRPTTIIPTKVMVHNHLLGHASFQPGQRVKEELLRIDTVTLLGSIHGVKVVRPNQQICLLMCIYKMLEAKVSIQSTQLIYAESCHLGCRSVVRQITKT